MTDLDATAIAGAEQKAAEHRLRRYARAEAARVRQGEGWVAVATGTAANDMNGVVSRPGAPISGDLVRDLIDWFAADALPASWLLEGEDETLAQELVQSGARLESSAWSVGRTIDAGLLQATDADVTISPVQSPSDLDDWLDVAQQCGWLDDDNDRNARRALYLSIGLDDGHLTHWVARRNGEVVGLASSHRDGNGVVDLCNLAVVERARRQGIGTALVKTRIRAAHAQSATMAVSALSPDGWELYRQLGFVSVPSVANRWFYLPDVRSG